MPQLSGKQHPKWKGGISQAYARKQWEEYHGRKPPKGHDVRHADEDRRNNSKENLPLLTHQNHAIHHKEQIYGNRIYRNKKWLTQKYLVEKLSMAEIGKLCDANSMTILRWLRRHGISTRKYSFSELGKILIEKCGHPPRDKNGHYLARVKILEGEK